MKVDIDIKGMGELAGKLNRLNQLAAVRVEEQVKKTAQKVGREARKRVPVDSGDTKKSIRARYSKDRLSAEIGPQGRKGWKAHFIEFGTVKMTARPFMTPAWEASKKGYIDGIGKALKKTVDDI